MIAAEDTALVLLAAGKSARFAGDQSKLDVPIGGVPLGIHAAHTLAALRFKARTAIVRRCRIDFAAHGYHVIENSDPIGDMASSLRLGVAFAEAQGAAAVLIALADMPSITASHVRRLLAAAHGPGAVIASTIADGVPRPPALFGSSQFEALMSLSGDQGARDLIRSGQYIEAPAAELVDIDTQEDLAALADQPRR